MPRVFPGIWKPFFPPATAASFRILTLCAGNPCTTLTIAASPRQPPLHPGNSNFIWLANLHRHLPVAPDLSKLSTKVTITPQKTCFFSKN